MNMSRPQSNGLMELHDAKLDRNEFFCMDLVGFMWNDEEVKGWDAWHGRFLQAEAGRCATATGARDTDGQWRNRKEKEYSLNYSLKTVRNNE